MNRIAFHGGPQDGAVMWDKEEDGKDIFFQRMQPLVYDDESAPNTYINYVIDVYKYMSHGHYEFSHTRRV